MTYQACVRARLVRLSRNTDDVITGALEANGKRFTFASRSDVQAAANRIFKSVSWTPCENDEIIFDGDIIQGHVIIDHIERWEPAAYQPLSGHDTLVAKLRSAIPAIPEFSRLLRQSAHNDNGETIRIARWQTPATGKLGHSYVPTIISAVLIGDDIRFRAQSVQGAKPVSLADAKLLPLLENAADPKKAGVRHADRAFVPRTATSSSSGRRKLRAGDPNKWIPGQPYKPLGMPVSENANDDLPDVARARADCPF